MHIDEWLDLSAKNIEEKYAKFLLEYFRLPVLKKAQLYDFMQPLRLYCSYKGNRYRCTGASRLGDIWLTEDFSQESGYTKRVDVNKCSDWGPFPYREGFHKEKRYAEI